MARPKRSQVAQRSRVFKCGDCGNIHLEVGPKRYLLSPETFRELAVSVIDLCQDIDDSLEWIVKSYPKKYRS